MWSWQRGGNSSGKSSGIGSSAGGDQAGLDLENEKLSKKYFEEKRLEFELACDQGDSGGCFSLGEWYLYFGKDDDKAHELFDKSCRELKNGNACFSLAQLYQAGKLGSSPEERETETFKLNSEACKFGNHAGCATAGLCRLQGFGCKKDPKEGLEMLAQSCNDNDAIGCFQLGRLYLDGGKKHGIGRNAEESFKHMYHACQLGHPNACQVVSVMYLKGDGVEKSEKQHAIFREKTMAIIRQTGERMGASVVP
jgi:TPR repeat protein